MRSLPVECVILADSCFDERDPVSEHVAASLRRVSDQRRLVLAVNLSGERDFARALGRLGLDWVRIVDSEGVSAGQAVQTELAHHGVSRDSVVAIGVLERDLELLEAAAIYLHVGHEDVLRRKARNLVPLTGQFGTGVANALDYLSRDDRSIDLLQYSDLVSFVDRTREQYAAPRCGETLLGKGVSAAHFIEQSLPEQVVGVFGTGYPFYLLNGHGHAPPMAPPTSVQSYFEEQAGYFRARCLPEHTFERNASARFDRDDLSRSLGIPATRNRFDAYLFEVHQKPVPQTPAGPHELREYLEHNCFDVSSDIWPCQMCTTLQSQENFPRQRQLKNTNTDCLGCRQTSLIVRNVMGAASDVDLIVVVRDDADNVAEQLKRRVIEDATYHLFDLELPRAIVHGDGPLDVFIFELNATMQALHRLTTSDWRNTEIAAVALWCPTAHFDARLDLCFPLAFEPIMISDAELARSYEATTKGFAAGATATEVMNVLHEGSFWTKQLMTNRALADALCARLDRWRG